MSLRNGSQLELSSGRDTLAGELSQISRSSCRGSLLSVAGGRMEILTSGRSRWASAARSSISWRERVLAVNSTTPWLMTVRCQPTQGHPRSLARYALIADHYRRPRDAECPRVDFPMASVRHVVACGLSGAQSSLVLVA